MECRIKAKLCEWVKLPEEELTEALRKLTGIEPDEKTIKRARKLFLETLDIPDGVKIQTIHSFCQGLMRRFPLEAGIVPHFKIMDDKTSRELLKEAQIRLLSDSDKYTPEIEAAVKKIFWRIREGTFSDVIKEIISDRGKLEKAIEHAGDISGLKKSVFNLLGVDEGLDEGGVLREAIAEGSFDRAGLLTCARQLLEESGKTFIERGNLICTWLEKDVASREADFDVYKLAFLTKENEPRKGLVPSKCNIPPEILLNEQERIYKLVNDVKKTRVAVLSASILDIAYSMLGGYGQLKSGKAYLDYNDLIMKSESLLSGSNLAPWVLYKLDGGIDHLLVDEAQDTSPEQWNIIDALCAEFFVGTGARDTLRTIFVVGDEKQSIFSFQGAAPQIFNKMQEKFKQRVEAAGKEWRSVTLDKSFRSSPVILKLVDEVGGQDNAISSPHVAVHKEMYGKIELWPLIEHEKKEVERGWVMPLEYLEKHDVRKILAEKIASEISRWLEEGRVLESEGRKVRAGDIMILLRKRKGMADNIISSLKSRKVPVAGHDRLIITEHLAVKDLIALGDFLLLPDDSLSLACVLKSPLISFSEDDLFAVAYGREKKSLWHSLKEKAYMNVKFRHAVDYLYNILNKVDFYTPFALYCYVLEASGGRKQLISRLGEEINDPVDEFLSLALSYEKSHAPSLQGFLSWLASGESEIKRDMEQGNANTVRVITVHGSKGLEAPIVIMPDTTSIPDSRNSRIFWHEGNVMLWPGSAENMEEICKSIKKRKADEDIEEYNRLLYVAMTRAKSELYIAGWVGKSGKKAGSWYDSMETAVKKIVKADEDGVYRLSGGVSKEQGSSKKNAEDLAISLPDYMLCSPKPEPTPSNPITPSRIEGAIPSGAGSLEGRQRIMEGKIIHSLLEFLPDIEAGQRYETGIRFLQRKFMAMPQIDFDSVLNKLLSIMEMEGLKEVFGKNSRSEVPIVGVVGGDVVSARIDRLCVLEKKIMIIDYKTGRAPPASVAAISGDYIRQMAVYSEIMQKIYPDKIIEAYLIWTEGAVVFDVSGNILEYRDKSVQAAQK